jgi:hypothetical protein
MKKPNIVYAISDNTGVLAKTVGRNPQEAWDHFLDSDNAEITQQVSIAASRLAEGSITRKSFRNTSNRSGYKLGAYKLVKVTT